MGNQQTNTINIALQQYEEAAQVDRQILENNTSIQNLTPEYYRYLLDEEKRIPLEELPSLFKKIQYLIEGYNKFNHYQTSEGEEFNSNYPTDEQLFDFEMRLNSLTGGLAVLICMHLDWLQEVPKRLEWCLDTLLKVVSSPPPQSSMSIPESACMWHWDVFAAEAAVILWEDNPQDPDLRCIIAELVFSPHNVSVGQLLYKCCKSTQLNHKDIQSLRRLVFEYAYVRNRIKFLYSPDIYEDEADTQNFKGTLNQWANQKIKDFVEGKLSPPNSNWSTMDNSGLLEHGDKFGQRHFDNYPLDFKLVRTAHEKSLELTITISTEERQYRIAFLLSALKFCVERLAHDNQEHRYPNDDERWLIDRIASAIGSMTAQEGQSVLWETLLGLTPNAHHWSRLFLDSFYKANLNKNPLPASFSELTIHFVETALNVPKPAHEEVWRALFGISYFARKLWQVQHSELASKLWPHMAEWISQDRVSPNHLKAVTLWLKMAATNAFRTTALLTLHDAIVGQDSWWPKHDRKDAEDAIADLLQYVWNKENAAIRGSEEILSAFLQLLKWLSDHQNVLGLELQRRIGRL